jgi:hypothetical protein
MANPFGSADEALSKNTGHANQANLVYAMIPRSVNKWREVINGADITPDASGNYDADGYWRSSNTTANFAQYTIGSPLDTGDPRTIVVGIRHNGAGGGSSTQPHAGVWNNANFTSQGRFWVRFQHYSREYQTQLIDGSGNAISALTTSQYNPGADDSAVYLRASSASTLQEAKYRVSGANTSMGSATSGVPLDNDAYLDRVGVRLTNKWAVQYLFVYNALLSEADINAIIDDPGSVISQGGAANLVVKIERGRGVGRGLGRGIF